MDLSHGCVSGTVHKISKSVSQRTMAIPMFRVESPTNGHVAERPNAPVLKTGGP